MTEILDVFKLLLKKKFGFKFIYSSSYWMVNIGKHVFPVVKYRILYERLLELGARKDGFLLPEPASDEDILRVHTAKYLGKLKTGMLSTLEVQVLEIPFSPELVKFAWLTTGGTVLAASEALKDGVAVHLGGGFHHAFPDHGEGFCVLNDIAVAVAKLLAGGRIRKAMIVDCDLHQGNGTAAIFSGESRVFTFSIHQMDNYPSEKVPSTLDVGLWSGDGDAAYLAALRENIPRLYTEFRPELVIYVAGADPYRGDQLGGLDLTIEGLKERDAIVIGEARKLKVPVAVVLAGGYASDVEDTVAIHLNTIKAAQKAC